MGNVVKFEAHGKEYPLSIIEREAERIVSLQQVGEAIGNKQPRRTLHDLKESHEIVEEKHCRSITEHQVGDKQARKRTYLTARGMIRFSMRSQGQRAREFRNWAEDVLYEVMTTGSYFSKDMKLLKISHENRNAVFNNDAMWLFYMAYWNNGRRDLEALDKVEEAICQFGEIKHSNGAVYKMPEEIRNEARELGFKQGLIFFEICDMYDISMERLIKHCRFRTLGLTQKEVAAACGVSVDQVKRIEKDLRGSGIKFKPVIGSERKKRFFKELPGALSFSPLPMAPVSIVNPKEV